MDYIEKEQLDKLYGEINFTDKRRVFARVSGEEIIEKQLKIEFADGKFFEITEEKKEDVINFEVVEGGCPIVDRCPRLRDWERRFEKFTDYFESRGKKYSVKKDIDSLKKIFCLTRHYKLCVYDENVETKAAILNLSEENREEQIFYSEI